MDEPLGLCACGCGGKTSIATRGYKRRNQKKGEPWKFIHGHFNRIRPAIEDAVPFKIKGVYCRLIPLSMGLYAIVDAIDYEWLMQWKWCAQRRRKGERHYASRSVCVEGTGVRKSRTIYMHREIAERAGMILPEDTDHWDRVGLNNTRKNLRPCDQSQNNANTGRKNGARNPFRGTGWCKKTKQPFARIHVRGVCIWLGYHPSYETAARAYDEAALIHYGEFAATNFSQEKTA